MLREVGSRPFSTALAQTRTRAQIVFWWRRSGAQCAVEGGPRSSRSPIIWRSARSLEAMLRTLFRSSRRASDDQRHEGARFQGYVTVGHRRWIRGRHQGTGTTNEEMSSSYSPASSPKARPQETRTRRPVPAQHGSSPLVVERASDQGARHEFAVQPVVGLAAARSRLPGRRRHWPS